MNYNDRVTLISTVTEEGFLDKEIVSEKKTIVPCYRGRLTNNQQMGIFGSYNLSAFKLHLQGMHENIEKIEYNGTPRKVHAVIHHRNSTVVVIQ